MSPTKCTHNCDLVFVFYLCQLNRLEHFDLIFSIKPVPGLNFDRGSSEFTHPWEILVKVCGKFLDSGLTNRLGSEPDPQALIVYVNIPLPIKFHLILPRSIPHKHRMSMCIDKTRQYAVFRAVHNRLENGLVGVKRINLLGCSNLFDSAR